MAGRRRFIPWGPAVAYAALIFLLSSLEGSQTPRFFPHSDKALHLLLYLPFGFLVLRALLTGQAQGRLAALRTALFVVSLYALTDEFHQLFVPGRTFSLWDWGADIIGAAAGIWLCYYGKNRSLSKPSL